METEILRVLIHNQNEILKLVIIFSWIIALLVTIGFVVIYEQIKKLEK